MRNVRKYRDRNIPVVLATKRKRKMEVNNYGNTQRNGKKIYIHGVLNHLPTRLRSENNLSINAHKNMMIRESTKKTKDSRAINKAMAATFADRRSLIVESNATLLHIKTEYPLLFQCQQVGTIHILQYFQSSYSYR